MSKLSDETPTRSQQSMEGKTSEDASRKVFEHLCGSFGRMSPPELSLENEDKVLMRFVRRYGFAKGIIEMFNHWIDDILPQQMRSRELDVPGTGKIQITEVMVERPYKGALSSANNNLSGDERERMYPRYAQEHGHNYQGHIKVKAIIKKSRGILQGPGDGAESIEYVWPDWHSIARIPIMLGSKYCWLSDLDDTEKIEIGECPNDPLGYFIIGGTPRVINIQESLRSLVNHTFVDNKGKIETRTTCPTIKGSTVTAITVGKRLQNLKVGLQHLNKQKHYPIILAYIMAYLPRNYVTREVTPDVFRAQIVSMCIDFVELVRQLCEPEHFEQVRLSLQWAIQKAINYASTPNSLIEYMGGKMSISSDELRSDPLGMFDRIQRSIQNDLYSHVPLYTHYEVDPNTGKVYDAKCKGSHLALATLNTIKYLLGLRPPDDRDSLGNKRLDTGAKSMEKLMNLILTNIYREAEEKIPLGKDCSHKSRTSSSYIFNICFSKITDTFRTSFQPNNWGYENDYNRENITDVLKRENPIAVYSQIGRINTPSSRQARAPSIRMLQASQVGYVCVSETPEGENLGLLKNITISGMISLERSVDTLQALFVDNPATGYKTPYTNYISRVYRPGWKPFMVNGVLEYFISTPEVDYAREKAMEAALAYKNGEIEKGGIPTNEVFGQVWQHAYDQTYKHCKATGEVGNSCNYGRDILGNLITFVEYQLRRDRRRMYLPIDSCISYNHVDNILEYFCDSSRPVRPLFVVETIGENKGKMVIDVIAEKEPEIWDADITTLFQRGCIELIDAREQEYIMLAMNSKLVRDRLNRKEFLERITGNFDAYKGAITKGVELVMAHALTKTQLLVKDFGNQLFKYYWGLEKVGKTPGFNQKAYIDALDLVVRSFFDTLIVAVVQKIYEHEGDIPQVDQVAGIIDVDEALESARIIASKTILDTIDENQREMEVDAKKLPQPANIDDVDKYSPAIAEQAAKTTAPNSKVIVDNMQKSYVVEYENIKQRVDYTHAEIDPLSIFGISGSLQPRPNCSQGPRSTYQASMAKQALGMYHFNHHLKFDKGFKVMQNPSRPMFETMSAEACGMNAAPTGTTAICAFIAMANNNEDAIVVNRDFINSNAMEIVKYSTYTSKIQGRMGQYTEVFRKPDIRPGEPASRYMNIDEFGIPKLDSYIHPGDCIIGRVKRDRTTDTDVNTSTFAGVGEEGFVDRVTILVNQDQALVVKVKLRRWSKHVSGDKIASRYAQKGTFSSIYESTELPAIVGGPNDGLVPHFFLNPHSIPSRMSVNKLEEMKASKAALYTGERIDATCFHNFEFDKWSRILIEVDQKYRKPTDPQAPTGVEHGDEILMWPNGKYIKDIFVAPCYYQCLRHHVKDKVQMRARGAIMPITHQPVGGRANEGGLRMGEMERDGLISHGATGLVLERLMLVSDAYEICFCKACGNIAVPDVNGDESRFICRVCDSKGIPKEEWKFVKRVIPYVLKVIFHILNGMGINTTLKFKQSQGRKMIDEAIQQITAASGGIDPDLKRKLDKFADALQ